MLIELCTTRNLVVDIMMMGFVILAAATLLVIAISAAKNLSDS